MTKQYTAEVGIKSVKNLFYCNFAHFQKGQVGFKSVFIWHFDHSKIGLKKVSTFTND